MSTSQTVCLGSFDAKAALIHQSMDSSVHLEVRFGLWLQDGNKSIKSCKLQGECSDPVAYA